MLVPVPMSSTRAPCGVMGAKKAVVYQSDGDVVDHIKTILFLIIVGKAVLSYSVAVVASSMLPSIFEHTASD